MQFLCCLSATPKKKNLLNNILSRGGTQWNHLDVDTNCGNVDIILWKFFTLEALWKAEWEVCCEILAGNGPAIQESPKTSDGYRASAFNFSFLSGSWLWQVWKASWPTPPAFQVPLNSPTAWVWFCCDCQVIHECLDAWLSLPRICWGPSALSLGRIGKHVHGSGEKCHCHRAVTCDDAVLYFVLTWCNCSWLSWISCWNCCRN